MNNDKPSSEYSDTTRAVLDLALDNMAGKVPDDVARGLRRLVEEHRLDDPKAVIGLLDQGKEEGNGGDSEAENPSNSGDS